MKRKTYTYNNLNYLLPTISLISASPIANAEIGMRVCYDSFSKSEFTELKDFNNEPKGLELGASDAVAKICDMHGSILEHVTVSMYIQNTSRACYSDDTEVLTSDGWKYFKDTTEDDMFMTMNMDSLKEEFQKATEHIEYHYNGLMHHYLSDTLDILVTPNHRMLFKKPVSGLEPSKLQCVPSEEIEYNSIKIPKTFLNYSGKGIDADTTNVDSYLALLAIYLINGSMYYNDYQEKFIIDLKTSDKRLLDIIRFHCGELGIIPRDIILQAIPNGIEFVSGIRLESDLLGTLFDNIDNSNRHLPIDVFDLTREQALKFLDVYVTFNGNNGALSSLFVSTEELANQIYNICLIAGYSPKCDNVDKIGAIGTNDNDDIFSNRVGFNISFRETLEITHQYDTVKLGYSDYDGNVYCVSVPNGTLFVRRDGSNASWCGNCLQEYSRHRIGNSLSVKSTRFTSSDVIKCFYASKYNITNPKKEFIKLYKGLNLLNVTDEWLVDLKISSIYDNIFNAEKMGVFVKSNVLSKDAVECVSKQDTYSTIHTYYKDLVACKNKRNVGDYLKSFIVDEMNNVDMLVTLNLRSLRELLKLRLPNSAWGPIQKLAEEMYKCLPEPYVAYMGGVNKIMDKR